MSGPHGYVNMLIKASTAPPHLSSCLRSLIVLRVLLPFFLKKKQQVFSLHTAHVSAGTAENE
jgi:hypothetical protein